MKSEDAFRESSSAHFSADLTDVVEPVRSKPMAHGRKAFLLLREEHRDLLLVQ
jgi:hypothetical protein